MIFSVFIQHPVAPQQAQITFSKKWIVEIRPSTKFFVSVQLDFLGPSKMSKNVQKHIVLQISAQILKGFALFQLFENMIGGLPASWFQLVHFDGCSILWKSNKERVLDVLFGADAAQPQSIPNSLKKLWFRRNMMVYGLGRRCHVLM